MSEIAEISKCLNCDHQLSKDQKFCPNCGQENKSLKIDFKHLLSEIFGTYFNLDSKFLKSLVPLLLNPGFLTTSFLEGKRARYIPPIRLYIVISVLYFFVLSLADRYDDQSGIINDQSDIVLSFKDTTRYSSSDEFIKAIESQGLKEYLDSIGAESTFDKFIVTQAYKVAQNKAEGFFEQYLSNVSILMFFLLPFFALLLKLFFKKQKHFYNEHLIFSFHLHAFIFLFLTVYSLITNFIINVSSFSFVLIVVFIYSFLAIKRAYQYNYKSTLGRLLLLLLIYNFTLVIGLLFTIFVSFALY